MATTTKDDDESSCSIDEELLQESEDELHEILLDEILIKFSARGFYYKKLMVLTVIGILIHELYFLNYIFAVLDVDYWCKYECIGDSNQFTDLVASKTDLDPRCYRFNMKQKGGNCSKQALNLSTIVKCTEWEYENTDSFVAEFNTACQDWKRTSIGTAHMMGSMFGQFIVGPLADKLGRKTTIIGSSLVAGIAGLAKSFLNSYWPYFTLEMLEGILSGASIVIYTYGIEMAAAKRRVLLSTVLQATLGGSDLVIATAAYLIPSWRTYLRTYYSMAAIFLFYIYLMDESSRWLLSTGRKEEAIHILKNSARRERVTIDNKLLQRLKTLEPENKETKYFHILKLTFKSTRLVRRLFGAIFLWATINFCINTLLINSLTLEGNMYINYAVTGAMFMPASLLLIFVLIKLKRKRPLVLAYFMTFFFSVVQLLIPNGYPGVTVGVYFVITFIASLASQILCLYTAEIFPTYIRATVGALCSSSGKFGAILAPQTPLLIRVWSGLPLVIIAVTMLASAIICTLMPNSANLSLPDDIAEALAM